MGKKEYRWNVFLLRVTPATPIGSPRSPTQYLRSRRRLKNLKLRNPQKQKRLVAQRQ
jgi:hypothetical protein